MDLHYFYSVVLTELDLSPFWFWYLCSILIFIFALSAWLIPQIIRFQMLKRKSVKNSFEKGAVEGPEVIREMSDDEVKSYNKALKKNLHNAIGGFALSLVLTYFLLFTFIMTTEIYPLFVEILVFPELLFFARWLVKNYNGYITKSKPVLCIKGAIAFHGDITKEIRSPDPKIGIKKVEQISFVVRAAKFVMESPLTPDGVPENVSMGILKSMKDGDIVIVEYTLLLNQVLKIQPA